jgi:hypothetical protein
LISPSRTINSICENPATTKNPVLRKNLFNGKVKDSLQKGSTLSAKRDTKMKIGQIEIDLISTLQEYKVKDTEGLQGDQVHVTNTRYNKSKREKSITGSSDQYSNYRILSKPRSKETHSNARHITEAEC